MYSTCRWSNLTIVESGSKTGLFKSTTDWCDDSDVEGLRCEIGTRIDSVIELLPEPVFREALSRDLPLWYARRAPPCLGQAASDSRNFMTRSSMDLRCQAVSSGSSHRAKLTFATGLSVLATRPYLEGRRASPALTEATHLWLLQSHRCSCGFSTSAKQV